MLAEAMRAPIVITHLGMFGELDPKEALNRIAKNLRTGRDAYKKAKIHSRLGIEASGRTEVVGSLDEILTLVKNAKGVLPVLNFAHVHARGFGLFKRPEDFDDVLSKVEKVSDGGHVHAHFSGVEHADGNELRYTPKTEEHTSELQSPMYLVCRLLLEKKNQAEELTGPSGEFWFRDYRQRTVSALARVQVTAG